MIKRDLTSVRYMLNNKHKGFWTVSPKDLVITALELMFANDVGAVGVLDNGILVGILTERDCTRKVLLQDKSARTTCICDVMTSQVYVVRLDQTVDDCMAIMNEKNVRHLPVVEDNRLVGIISIRDAVRYRLSEQAFMIEQLETHIYGGHPASRA
ncbi:MAG: CBS domain-containing protein [Chloroflexales bacterium]|nr:CBS domain-containing protein [Chloroflexales bacterium]